ncbi:MAG: electron transfer flavoprotein subunit alpha/FixB family protein, partial [Gammaproteobacteria bacterium]
MKALVIAVHDDDRVDPATLSAITAARQITPAVDLLVAGKDCAGVARSLSALGGIGQVLLCDHDACAGHLPENVAPLVQRLAPGYSHLLAPATTEGKNLMPRVAALLDAAQVSEIIAVESPDTYRRPIYAGNVIATVRNSDPLQVLTVRPTAFEPAAAEGGETAPVVEVNGVEDAGLSKVVETCLAVSERPDLASAEIVVSGGRGLGSKEKFALVYELADRLGAAVGATRAAVDAGFIGNEAQVG